MYKQFMEWRILRPNEEMDENMFLVYFTILKTEKKYLSSTLWSIYSMLKRFMRNKHGIDMATYHEVKAYIKMEGIGQTPKKSKIFTAAQISEFLVQCPDEHYLDIKVILIFGIAGGLRREELCHLEFSDVRKEGSNFVINVNARKTHTIRTFTVEGQFVQIDEKYMALRPQVETVNCFFLNYRSGKCTQQPIGINKIGFDPFYIAKNLGLTDPEAYTGRCFRRTSATLLADAGADVRTLKQHGGWKSDKVAEGYCDNSIANKRKIYATR